MSIARRQRKKKKRELGIEESVVIVGRGVSSLVIPLRFWLRLAVSPHQIQEERGEKEHVRGNSHPEGPAQVQALGWWRSYDRAPRRERLSVLTVGREIAPHSHGDEEGENCQRIREGFQNFGTNTCADRSKFARRWTLGTSRVLSKHCKLRKNSSKWRLISFCGQLTARFTLRSYLQSLLIFPTLLTLRELWKTQKSSFPQLEGLSPSA